MHIYDEMELKVHASGDTVLYIYMHMVIWGL